MLAPSYHEEFRTHADTDYISVYGAPIPCAQALRLRPHYEYRFAIYWDEDKDHRILRLADTLLHHNALGDFIAFTEHEGWMGAIVQAGLPPARIVTALDILNEAAADVVGDSWSWGVVDSKGYSLALPKHLRAYQDGYPLDLRPDELQRDIKDYRLGVLDRLDDDGQLVVR